jgi:hypothetical protein
MEFIIYYIEFFDMGFFLINIPCCSVRYEIASKYCPRERAFGGFNFPTFKIRIPKLIFIMNVMIT